MNLSGKAVGYWLQTEKIPAENLLVVVDDIALPFGLLRMRGKGSDGGHNGLKDIARVLGNEEYARIRMGIGNEFGRGQQVDYVLSEWSDSEAEMLPCFVEKANNAVLSFGTIGLGRTMNLFNTK